MFNFNRVLNATSGERYTITGATLKDEELDVTPNGANSYQIDLDPEDPESKPIYNVSLCVFNNGSTALLTKNLDPDGATHEVVEGGQSITREDMTDAIIEGRTLIVTTNPRRSQECGGDQNERIQSPFGYAEYFDNVTAAIEALVKVWNADGVSPKERVLRLQRAFPEILPELPPDAFPSEEA